MSFTKVDDYDLYALLYAGEEDEDGNAKFTPEEAAQAAEEANGKVKNLDSSSENSQTDESENDSVSPENKDKNKDNEKRERICLMKVLSLFDGISCGMLALERAGIDVKNYDAFEIDKYAIKVSEKNYPQIVHHGDVFDGDFTKFKGYDLLLGGSPCTYWSIAKKGRETTSDGMGFKLFMEYVRALRESECKYFLYENNFSIHKNIKAEISKYLGVEPIIINSALLSAQNRKRCYWTNIPNVMQTLPDNYTAGISNTQRYKCIGNGWTVDVIAHILGGLRYDR